MFISIGAAAELLGVSLVTLRRWEKEGFLLPSFRTKGNHRRYRSRDLLTLFQGDTLPSRKVHAVAYARVSSHDQKKDLEAQSEKLKAYCDREFASYEVISDLGSGLNYKKPGFRRLLKLIFSQKVTHLILNHKDRLLRFGTEIIFELCRHFAVHCIVLEKPQSITFEEELSRDVIELMTVFSARLYGRRSHQNRKAVA